MLVPVHNCTWDFFSDSLIAICGETASLDPLKFSVGEQPIKEINCENAWPGAKRKRPVISFSPCINPIRWSKVLSATGSKGCDISFSGYNNKQFAIFIEFLIILQSKITTETPKILIFLSPSLKFFFRISCTYK